jgi:hypothetical protein
MVFLVLDEDIPHVQLRPVPGKALYRVDSLTSPVIEFSPCFWNGSEMRPGRLFLEPRYYVEKRQVEKPSSFLQWSTGVLSTCRKVLTLDRATKTLWGKEAARLRSLSQLILLPS